MIKKTTKAVAIATLLSASLFVQNAHAILVFDPSNFARNTVTAIQSVEAQVTRLNQLQLQVKENLNTFGGKDIANLRAEYSKVNATYNSAMNLKSSIVGVQNNFNNVSSVFGSGNFSSFSAFTADMSRRKSIASSISNNLYTNSQNAQVAMKTAFENHQKVVEQASSVNGVTEASQSTTAAVGVLIQQNNALLGMMSADQMKKSIDTVAASEKRQQEDQFGADYKQQLANDNARLNAKYAR